MPMKANQYAFPHDNSITQHHGIDVRTYIAAQVLAGLAANANENVVVLTDEKTADIAVDMTDALLKRLQRVNPE